ncbi:MAG: hypothetical protein HQM15_08310 [Deltaproteobacteria bacterium]|nr:hypothetical protein [Deltaproteobacteria bacterium]
MLFRKRIRTLSFWIALGLFGGVSTTWVRNAQAMEYYATNRSLNIARGGTASSAIQIIPYGSTGPVTFTLTGGNGITAAVPAINITSNADINSRVTFSASATASTGNQNLVLTGKVGTSTYRQSFSLNVTGTAASTFTLALSSASLSEVQGQSASSNITLSRSSFTNPVAFSVTGLPVGVSAAFSANNTTANSSTLTLSASTAAAAGSFTIAIQAVGGTITRTANLNLSVQTPGSFAVTASPVSVTLIQGQAAFSVAVNITRTNFTNAVALSLTGYPGGVTASFSPASSTGNTSSLSLTPSASATVGTFAATLNAVSGGITQSVPLSITVNAVPANFTLSASPTSLSLGQGNSGSFALNVARTNLPDSVAFTVSGVPSGVTVSCPATTSNSSTCTVNVASSATVASSSLNIQASAAGISRTVAVSLSVTAPAATGLKAFPSAEGFGAVSTTGGRGGTVCKVSNLNNSGPGSLQDCFDLPGPAYIVFTVGGIIDASLECHYGNKTVAGQTSPTGIITRGIIFDNVYETNPGCQNIILRHLHSRPAAGERAASGYVNDDSIRLDGVKNIVLDHMSFERASDESFQLSRSSDITVQNSILAESLSDHYWDGMLINYSTTVQDLNRLSIHHNMWNRIRGRLPEISCEENADGRLGTTNCSGKRLQLELSNNLLFDPNVDPIWYNRCTGTNAGNDCAATGPSFFVDLNWVGNYMKARTGSDNAMLGYDFQNESRNGLFYQDDFFDAGIACLIGIGHANASAAFAYPSVTYIPAQQVTGYMQNNVGPFPRDPMDQRLVSYLSQDINSVAATPSAPPSSGPLLDAFNTLSSSCAYPADTDNDGMPDIWEIRHGLNPAVDDHNGINLSSEGYTNIEMYLEELNNQVVARGSSTDALCNIASW